MEIFEEENNCPVGWDLVQVAWAFLNVVFDDAAPVTAEHGLHQRSLILLAMLDQADTPQAIAQLLRSPASTVSHMVSELERKQFIERAVDPHDKRSWRLRRTTSGQHALDGGMAAINAAVAARLHRLEPEERQALTGTLPLFARVIEKG